MKEKIVLLLSVAVGLVAFLLTHQYIKSKEAELQRKEKELYEGAQKVDIVVAAADLPKGAVLRMEDIRWKSAFRNALVESHVRRDEYKQVVGQKLLYSVKTGDPIFWTYIDTPYRPTAGLAPMIQNEMRAVSVAVGGENAVSGLVKPNDRVDILGTFQFPSKSAQGEWETVTFTLLQNVTVLATGQELARAPAREKPGGERRSGAYNAVTFELTPAESELLVFARAMKGGLTLTLRNPSDVSYLDESALKAVKFDDLEKNVPLYNKERQKRQRAGAFRQPWQTGMRP